MAAPRTMKESTMAADDSDRRSPWTPFLVRLIVALIVATPFIAIILQALGKH